MRFATIGAIIFCAAFAGLAVAQKPPPKTRIEREKENDDAFAKLTYAQKRWVTYKGFGYAKADRKYEVGWMGDVKHRSMTTMQVVSETEAIIYFEYEGGGSNFAWFSGIDTAKMTDESRFVSDDIFWIPKTTTYETALGASNTVFQFERIPDGDKIKGLHPPKGVKLSDFPPK